MTDDYGKLKGFDAFSVIGLKGQAYFLIRKFLKVFYFLSALVIVAKSFENRFSRSLISKYVFPVIMN